MARPGQTRETDLAGLLDAVARLVPVPLLVTDHRGHLLASNLHWQRLSGSQATAPDAGSWSDCLSAPARGRLRAEMERAAISGSQAMLDLEMDLPSGPRWSRWWIHRRLIDSTPVLVLVVVDVHEDVTQKNDLRQLASRDDLTGLFNRRFFLETVEQALRRAERFPEPVCLLYVDLDSFKLVNDRAGHAVGDRVLAAVASRLRKAVRGADVVGRIGGDEFAVLIERLAEPGEAAIVVRRIQEALSGSVEVAGRRWPISASIGIAMTRDGHETAMDLLTRADGAMYAAKRARGGPPRAEEAATVPPIIPPPRSTGLPPSPAPTAAREERGAVLTRSDRPDGRESERRELDRRKSERRGFDRAEAAATEGARRPVGAQPARTGITTRDLRNLRDGMETVRQSLERLLEGLESDRR